MFKEQSGAMIVIFCQKSIKKCVFLFLSLRFPNIPLVQIFKNIDLRLNIGIILSLSDGNRIENCVSVALFYGGLYEENNNRGKLEDEQSFQRSR